MEISIKTLTASQLEGFINSGAFKTMPVVPISGHRAVSQANNPACGSDDIVMILAYAGEDMAGYLGIVPDIFSGGIKAGWLSCIWADKTYRQYGISQKMIKAALDSWQQQIIGSAYVPQIKSMYERAGFLTNYKPLEGRKFYIKATLAKLVAERLPKYKRYTAALRLTDGLYNGLFSPAAGFLKSAFKSHQNNNSKVVSRFDSGADKLISLCRMQVPETGTRFMKDIDWMLQYPWISENKADAEPRYFFSSYSPHCRFIPVTIPGETGDTKVLLLLLLREGHLKLQYIYAEQGYEKQAVAAIDGIAKAEPVHTITILHKSFAEHYRKQSSLFFMSKLSLRPFIISEALDRKLQTFNFQPGDGDCAFT